MLKYLLAICLITTLMGCSLSLDSTKDVTYKNVNITIVTTSTQQYHRSRDYKYMVEYFYNNEIDTHVAESGIKCFNEKFYEPGKTYTITTGLKNGKYLPIDNLCVLTAKIISANEKQHASSIK